MKAGGVNVSVGDSLFPHGLKQVLTVLLLILLNLDVAKTRQEAKQESTNNNAAREALFKSKPVRPFTIPDILPRMDDWSGFNRNIAVPFPLSYPSRLADIAEARAFPFTPSYAFGNVKAESYWENMKLLNDPTLRFPNSYEANQYMKTNFGGRRDRGESRIHTNGASCPPLPLCHWPQFEPIQMKVQQGAQSKVNMLLDHATDMMVIKKSYTSMSDYRNELRALACVRAPDHPYIVQPVCADPKAAVIVLEWAGEGDLTRWSLFTDPVIRYSYHDVANLAAQIVSAVATTHRRGILHGDIKPENFVVSLRDKTLKLIDFGLSATIGHFRIMDQGTPLTMAPEVAFKDFFDERIEERVDGKKPKKFSERCNARRFSNVAGGPNSGNDQDTHLFSSQAANFDDKPQTIREAMDWWSVGVTIHYLFAKYLEEIGPLGGRNGDDALAPGQSPAKQTARTPLRTDYVSNRKRNNSVASGEDSEQLWSDVEPDDHYFPYRIVYDDKHDNIIDFKYRPIPDAFAPDLVDLIDLLMGWNPEERDFKSKGLMQIINHPFFENNNVDWYKIDPQLYHF